MKYAVRVWHANGHIEIVNSYLSSEIANKRASALRHMGMSVDVRTVVA